ncbi:DUF2057 domain-containing protein [Shewanella gelidii]|uniref:UPF0319 protein n=1 Tax=Shewanella gelidii TaxID=1642821 RepID=A0A917JLM9_9GAMM|nr:DUF2057 domain-containing protein [Shewanella gelidii]MCL1097462.1 DUF2057 domain-containing protein [Shewanella gelidii]GGI75398.1 UPF0319 protein [Shewanella gelidii]
MKKLLSASAILALVSSTSVFAANLNIPMDFEYLALDGKKVKTSLFKHKADLDLTQGEHKIAIRYADMIDDDFNDSQSEVSSKPFVITIQVDGDHEYKLKPAEGEFVRNPHKFAEKPQIVIRRTDNGPVNYAVTQTNIEEKSYLSSVFGGDSNDQAEKHIVATTAAPTTAPTAPVAVVAPATAVAATATVAPISAPAVKAPAATDARAQQMLQYWWSQADEKTKKEFMSWAIQQL